MQDNTTKCPDCGEVMPQPHNCNLAIQARAIFEAAKRANSPDSARALGDLAYEIAVQAEQAHVR